MKKSVCNTCVYAVNNNHCGLRSFRSDFNVKYCSAQNVDKLPNGFELQEDGYFSWINKKPKYPTTYEECCNIIEFSRYDVKIILLLENVRNLLICRDTYWKIAGDELGLGKPWEPDWNEETDKFTISNKCNKIYLNNTAWYAEVLSFPTAEMRDAFYENFKDLIERCKELL